MPNLRRSSNRGEPCKKALPPQQIRDEGLAEGALCGVVHERCLGHAKKVRGGRYEMGIKPCRAKVVEGLEVCKTHGGISPMAVQKLARMAAAEQAAKSLREQEVVPIGDPIEELKEHAAVIKAHLEFWTNLVGDLKRDELRYQVYGGEQMRSEIAIAERMMDRYTKALEAVIRVTKTDPDAAKAGQTLLDIVKNLSGRSDPDAE